MLVVADDDKRSSLLRYEPNIDRKRLHNTSPRGRLVEHLSPTEAAQQSVAKIKYLVFINLVTPTARAKHEHLFNKQASGLSKLDKARPR